ncbi:hypothetical protein [Pectinatus frisingensis]|uniref:hypothetical protein n=1 Tax=Pectinatus frisingensis TaxID=865 RepID=UPI0018C7F4D8|nr:hypothetical protein [Pectinatus frisingensis]
MLVQDLINLINLEADELLDEDTDNIPYINQAIDYLSFTLCGMGDPEMINVMDITSNVDVPGNFVDFIPHNGYPIYIQTNKFWVMTSNGLPIKQVKYSTAKAHISAVTDTIPFKDMYSGVLVLIASYLIKKKTYIPVEYCNEDKSFVSDVLNAIKAAKGVTG